MSFPFSPHHDLIVVDVELDGAAVTIAMRFALDTGATDTVVSKVRLMAAGYDPDVATQHVQMTTGSGIVSTPLLWVTRLRALGQDRTAFPVLAHQCPPSSDVDGLLGLDFLRGHELNINFRVRGPGAADFEHGGNVDAGFKPPNREYDLEPQILIRQKSWPAHDPLPLAVCNAAWRIR